MDSDSIFATQLDSQDPGHSQPGIRHAVLVSSLYPYIPCALFIFLPTRPVAVLHATSAGLSSLEPYSTCRQPLASCTLACPSLISSRYGLLPICLSTSETNLQARPRPAGQISNCLSLLTPSNFPATPGLASSPASRRAMAPSHHSKKYAVASEKSSGTGNLNMRVGSLNPQAHQTSPQYSRQQQPQMVNARSTSKNSTRHPQAHPHAQQQQQQQPTHPNLAQTVAPARNANSGPAGGPGTDQVHASGDSNNNFHVSVSVTLFHSSLTCSLSRHLPLTACTAHPGLAVEAFLASPIPLVQCAQRHPQSFAIWLRPWSMFRVVYPSWSASARHDPDPDWA